MFLDCDTHTHTHVSRQILLAPKTQRYGFINIRLNDKTGLRPRVRGVKHVHMWNRKQSRRFQMKHVMMIKNGGFTVYKTTNLQY